MQATGAADAAALSPFRLSWACLGPTCPWPLQGTPVRIVLVSSLGHLGGKLDRADLLSQRTPVSGSQLYFNSKLLNVLHAKELARRHAFGNGPWGSGISPQQRR